MKTLWKSLPKDLSPNGFKYEVGKWHKHEGEISMCSAGFHASERAIDAIQYVNCEVLALVEVRGKSEKQKDKQVWREMRIIKTYEWKKEYSVRLAIFAAEKVIDIFEKKYPNDKRPREAIEAAKNWLKNPTAAWAAEESARAAEEAAAWAAARAARAAGAAAWAAWAAADAAGAAAWAAWAASWAAEESARASRAARAEKILDDCEVFIHNLLKECSPTNSVKL